MQISDIRNHVVTQKSESPFCVRCGIFSFRDFGDAQIISTPFAMRDLNCCILMYFFVGLSMKGDSSGFHFEGLRVKVYVIGGRSGARSGPGRRI